MSDLPVRLFIATKAFVQHKGLVLILRESTRYADGVQAGKFDVPGGRMTVEGEAFLDSLRREVHEESGLEIHAIKPFFVNEFRVTKPTEIWQVVAIYFAVESDSSKVVLSEDHCEHQWIDPQTYRDYPLIESLQPVFEAYLLGKNTH